MQPTDAIMEPYMRLLAAQQLHAPQERAAIEERAKRESEVRRYTRKLPKVY